MTDERVFKDLSIKFLITGSSGFIGGHLVDYLADQQLLLLVRKEVASEHRIAKKSFFKNQDYREQLRGADVVIHLAGLAHQATSESSDQIDKYFDINTHMTQALAEQAAEVGVKHFIFLSSSKVFGEQTTCGQPLDERSDLNPSGPYAASKAAAESVLLQIAARTKMVVSIIRPPLVYGPGVKANFARLVKLAKYRFPFPNNDAFGKRSFVSVWNVCSLIRALALYEPKSSSVYMVSDNSDCTTAELYRYISQAYGKTNPQFNISSSLVRFILSFIGQQTLYTKLFSECRLSIDHAVDSIGWYPEHTTEEGIKLMFIYRHGRMDRFSRSKL